MGLDAIATNDARDQSVAAGTLLGQEELARLLAVGRGLVSELDLETVLHQVLETARDLTSARFAALGILDEQKGQLERFLTVGLDDEVRRAIGPLPRGHGVLGELIRNPQPLRLPDVTRRRAGKPSRHAHAGNGGHSSFTSPDPRLGPRSGPSISNRTL